jgi:hypothetical protein
MRKLTNKAMLLQLGVKKKGKESSLLQLRCEELTVRRRCRSAGAIA